MTVYQSVGDLPRWLTPPSSVRGAIETELRTAAGNLITRASDALSQARDRVAPIQTQTIPVQTAGLGAAALIGIGLLAIMLASRGRHRRAAY
jgi:hypothetical protein